MVIRMIMIMVIAVLKIKLVLVISLIREVRSLPPLTSSSLVP